jgi:hypothetical protein
MPMGNYTSRLTPARWLSQLLVASTYSLEIVQLVHWLEKTGSFMNEKTTKGEQTNEI